MLLGKHPQGSNCHINTVCPTPVQVTATTEPASPSSDGGEDVQLGSPQGVVSVQLPAIGGGGCVHVYSAVCFEHESSSTSTSLHTPVKFPSV